MTGVGNHYLKLQWHYMWKSPSLAMVLQCKSGVQQTNVSIFWPTKGSADVGEKVGYSRPLPGFTCNWLPSSKYKGKCGCGWKKWVTYSKPSLALLVIGFQSWIMTGGKPLLSQLFLHLAPTLPPKAALQLHLLVGHSWSMAIHYQRKFKKDIL